MFCIRDLHPLMSEAIESTEVKADQIAFVSEGQTTLQIAGRQLSSLYDPILEAEIQAATLPENESLSIWVRNRVSPIEAITARHFKTTVKIKPRFIHYRDVLLFQETGYLIRECSLTRHDCEVDVPFFCSPAEALFPEAECELIGERLRHELNQKFVGEHFSALKDET